MCTETWVPARNPRGKDDGEYKKKDCGRCSCRQSSAQHTAAREKDPPHRRYCSRCQEIY